MKRHRFIYYAAMAALAAGGFIDWPVVLIVLAGHELSHSHIESVREVGQAMEQAG